LDQEQKNQPTLHSIRIVKYIDSTIGHCDSLIEKAQLTTTESSLLMFVIWNIIAQKTNNTNQSIANESKSPVEKLKRIADESKSLQKARQD
jgi:hypothetical protein